MQLPSQDFRVSTPISKMRHATHKSKLENVEWRFITISASKKEGMACCSTIRGGTHGIRWILWTGFVARWSACGQTIAASPLSTVSLAAFTIILKHWCTCSSDRSHLPFLEQSVTITGLGETYFNTALSNLNELTSCFNDASYPNQSTSPTVVPSQPYPSLKISNRYFVTKSTAQSPTIDFDYNEDPNQYLTLHDDEQLCHTEDNKVTYYQVREPQDIEISR